MEKKIITPDQLVDLINNPAGAESALLEKLSTTYSFSGAIWFIKAKHSVLNKMDDSVETVSQAALYGQDTGQLYDYIYHPLPIEAHDLNSFSSDPLNEDSIVSPVLQHAETAKATLNRLLSAYLNKGEAEDESTSSHSDPLDVDLEENIVDDLEQDKKQLPSQDIEADKQEQLSRYDDDLMPYTFVWWLHKTRLEHADTYQPYASKEVKRPKSVAKDNGTYLLDQQVRENIFHLQSPEIKLQKKFSENTIAFKVPKKTDEMIERFIKEEPQIKPPQADKITLENKAKNSAEDASDFVSETLATIYAEQGLYHKAIEVHKKLSLKYPEKSSYFANRITELEKKIN